MYYCEDCGKKMKVVAFEMKNDKEYEIYMCSFCKCIKVVEFKESDNKSELLHEFNGGSYEK